MNGALTVVTAVLLLTASSLALIAAIGLVRFRTVFGRAHPVTKAITLGMVLVCLGAAIRVADTPSTAKLLLVALFQVITAPIAGHMIARAAHRTASVSTAHLVMDELREADRDTEPTGHEDLRPVDDHGAPAREPDST